MCKSYKGKSTVWMSVWSFEFLFNLSNPIKQILHNGRGKNSKVYLCVYVVRKIILGNYDVIPIINPSTPVP